MACMKEVKCKQGLVGKFKEKQPLRRPRCRWEITVKVNLKHFHSIFFCEEGLCFVKLIGS